MPAKGGNPAGILGASGETAGPGFAASFAGFDALTAIPVPEAKQGADVAGIA
jgi:hypothetical protein